MLHALHPRRNCLITPQAHRLEFGARPIERGNLVIPPARCPFCLQPLAIRAETPNRRAHFWHNIDPCSGTDFGAQPFPGAGPLAAPGSAAALRRQFRETWRAHYHLLAKLIPKFSVDEFCKILRRSCEQRIWNYADLELRIVPYVLVMLADFTPWSGIKGKDGGRNEWFRFIYPAREQDPNVLWNRVEPVNSVIRISLDPPTDHDNFPDIDSARFTEFEFQERLDNIDRNYKDYVVENVERVLDELRF